MSNTCWEREVAYCQATDCKLSMVVANGIECVCADCRINTRDTLLRFGSQRLEDYTHSSLVRQKVLEIIYIMTKFS